MAFASLIIALGALLLGALSLLVSTNNRKEMIQVRAEQRKQEALGILRQADITNRYALRSLRNTKRSAVQYPNNVKPEALAQIEEAINEAEESDRQFNEMIRGLEEMKPPQGRVSSSYLVDLETRIGNAQSLRTGSEFVRVMSVHVYDDMLNLVSHSGVGSDSYL